MSRSSSLFVAVAATAATVLGSVMAGLMSPHRVVRALIPFPGQMGQLLKI